MRRLPRKMMLGAALVLVLMLTVPHFMATTSGAYKLAVATAHESPRFIDALGAPVTEAWFSEGKEVRGKSSEMLIPVRGGIRRGDLRVRAVKDGRGWRLTELTLSLDGQSEPIDLLSK